MTRARLHAARLTYGGGLRVHTASSGAVDALEELVLAVEDGDETGIGAVRINIAYLNGFSPDAVVVAARRAVGRLVAARIVEPRAAAALLAAEIAPVRMLVDVALHDLTARRAGTGVSALIGGPAGPLALSTNQTLFQSGDAEMIARAEAYVARGFTSLKLRVGAAAFPDDLRRLARLRDRFGDAIEIVVDANGRWPLAEAPERLAMLAPYRLAYVEQPVTADLDVIAGLARESPVPVMLDESVDSPAAVDAVAAAGGVLWAHLKLVKLGGIGPTADAARKLAAAGVPFMIGQMNEGAIATAAAVHVAAAVAPRFRELYGADGLVDDPASGLSYGDGRVRIADGRGLGIAFDPSGTRIIEEYDA